MAGWSKPGDADHRAGLRRPRRPGPAGDRGRRPHALLEAPRAGGDPARRARGQRGAGNPGREPLMADVVMPRLSDSMEEGTILKWLKSVGDEVAVGDELVEIETDKANMVYEADSAGTLVEIVAEEGDTLPIGEPIARVGDASEVSSSGNGGPGGAASAGGAGDGAEEKAEEAGKPAIERREPAAAAPPAPQPATSGGAAPPTSPAAAATPPPPSTPQAEGDGRVKASPIARRLARDKGLDLSALSGSGPGGRIVKADVEKAAKSGAPAAAPPRRLLLPRHPPADRPHLRPRRVPRRARGRSRRPRRGRSRWSSRPRSSRRSPGGWRSRRRPRRISTSRPRST